MKGIHPPCYSSHDVSKGRSDHLGISLGRGWRKIYIIIGREPWDPANWVWPEDGDRPLKLMTACLQRRWAAKEENNLSSNPGRGWKWSSWWVLCREQSFSSHVASSCVSFSECRVEKRHKILYEVWKPGQVFIPGCRVSIRISLMGLDEFIWNHLEWQTEGALLRLDLT